MIDGLRRSHSSIQAQGSGIVCILSQQLEGALLIKAGFGNTGVRLKCRSPGPAGIGSARLPRRGLGSFRMVQLSGKVPSPPPRAVSDLSNTLESPELLFGLIDAGWLFERAPLDHSSCGCTMR